MKLSFLPKVSHSLHLLQSLCPYFSVRCNPAKVVSNDDIRLSRLLSFGRSNPFRHNATFFNGSPHKCGAFGLKGFEEVKYTTQPTSSTPSTQKQKKTCSCPLKSRHSRHPHSRHDHFILHSRSHWSPQGQK